MLLNTMKMTMMAAQSDSVVFKLFEILSYNKITYRKSINKSTLN